MGGAVTPEASKRYKEKALLVRLITNCKVEGCFLPFDYFNSGLCQGHHTSLRKYGSPKPNRMCVVCEEIFVYDPVSFGSGSSLNREICSFCRDVKFRYVGRHIKRHGITTIEATRILISQNCLCALCEIPFASLKEKPHVDHDHECCPGGNGCAKCVRGYLCRGCNNGVGYHLRMKPYESKMRSYLERRS